MIDFEKPLWDKNIIVAGIDEAGRGALAGPVVAAAVVANPGMIDFGINDSKKLSHTTRLELFEIILENADDIGVGIVYHDIIDEINILNATFLAMHGAVESLTSTPGHLLIDGNHFKNNGIEHTLIIKGDSKSLSIASASIIAKVVRDNWMEEVADSNFPDYLFKKHKGYGTREHRERILLHNTCSIHRLSFCKVKSDNQLKIL